jgi:hypothetical protein
MSKVAPLPRLVRRDCAGENQEGFRPAFGIKNQSPVAQLVEQHAVNVPVRGSSPRGGVLRLGLRPRSEQVQAS